MHVNLRPYQQQLVDDIRGSFRTNRRVLAVAPTGSGKTVTFSYIAANAASKGKRVMIVAHRIEIVEQISLALDRFGVRHGRIWPGNSMTGDLVNVAMIQSLARRMHQVEEPALLVVDEAHHAVAGQWSKVADQWTKARHLGVTATPQRADGRGLGAAFDDMVIGPSVGSLIEGGFLAGFDYFAPPQQADLSGIKTRAGDFAIDELANAMDRATITGDAVSHYHNHLGGRSAIAFCVTVEHAQHVADQFARAGIRAASVDGSMDKATRSNRIASIGDGRLQVLTSCDLISEGTDIPSVAGAILLRPTQSLSTFLQQVGRVLRPKADGSRAIILDHVGNAGKHGLPDEDRQWTLDVKPSKPKSPTLSVCKACYRNFAQGASGQPCPDQPGCLFGPKLTAERREMEIVSGELQAIHKAEAERLAVIRRTPLSVLMKDAHTRDQVAEIAKLRGYKAGWVFKVMEERKRVRGGVAA